jgi:MYXO-CTERM domain-containing protein
MFGDWREELMMEQSGGATLRIYTTAIPTEKRLYTLMHNPEYRNAMVEKGYTQSRFVDYYLGEGMTDPPKPNITYPDGCVGCAGAGGGGTTGAAGASGSVGTTEAAGASGSGGKIGAGSGGSILSDGTPSTGGAVATGGRGGRGGSVVASGGNPGNGGTTVVVDTGGAGMAGAGGTSAVVPETGGSTSGGAGGAVAGQSGTSVVHAAAASGCSCAIGASARRTSPGYLVAVLGVLGLVLNRRRQRVRSQK